MSDLPALTALEIIRALERAGFVVRRSKGSHRRLIHRADPSRATTVPVHSGTVAKPLVLRPAASAQLGADVRSDRGWGEGCSSHGGKQHDGIRANGRFVRPPSLDGRTQKRQRQGPRFALARPARFRPHRSRGAVQARRRSGARGGQGWRAARCWCRWPRQPIAWHAGRASRRIPA